MIISKTISEIRSELEKNKSQKIAFVPTMGSLHQGHLELVKCAKEYADIVVVSVFVNKAQFNNPDDYENYPRNLDQDSKLLRNAGATHLFAPLDDEMLLDDSSPRISSSELVNCLCGTTRPGHFEGVYFILTRFFNIINPDFAIFGKKDFQQYLVVKALVKDQNYKTKIIGLDPVREVSGLVMSSRNERLDDEQKELAAEIINILNEIKQDCLENPGDVSQILQKYKDKMTDMGFGKIDYLEVRSEADLSLVNSLKTTSGASRIFIAVYIGQIRLIDNIAID